MMEIRALLVTIDAEPFLFFSWREKLPHRCRRPHRTAAPSTAGVLALYQRLIQITRTAFFTLFSDGVGV